MKKNYTGRWEVIFDPIHIISNNAQLAASIQDYKLNTQTRGIQKTFPKSFTFTQNFRTTVIINVYKMLLRKPEEGTNEEIWMETNYLIIN